MYFYASLALAKQSYISCTMFIHGDGISIYAKNKESNFFVCCWINEEVTVAGTIVGYHQPKLLPSFIKEHKILPLLLALQ